MARGTLTAEQVVARAADLADEVGFGAVTVSVLARHLGIRTPSLYSHIGGVEDLRLRLAALALTESADAVTDAIEGRRGAGAVSAYGDAWREFAWTHPGRYDATRQRVPEEDGRSNRARATMLAAGRRHADLARAVLEDYGLSGVEETHAVRLLGSTVHGFVSLELSGGFAHSSPSSTSSWRHLLRTLDFGLRHLAQA